MCVGGEERGEETVCVRERVCERKCVCAFMCVCDSKRERERVCV